MMAEAPDTFDPTEVDEPTQPYSRKEIELLRRGIRPSTLVGVGDGTVRIAVVAPPVEPDEVGVHETDEEWCEIAGRRIRVSLAALEHIGLAGGPPGMITCRQSTWISGEIRRDDDAPSTSTARFTTIHAVVESGAAEIEPTAQVESIPQDFIEYEHPGRRRVLWMVGAAMALALAFATRGWFTNRGQVEGDGIVEQAKPTNVEPDPLPTVGPDGPSDMIGEAPPPPEPPPAPPVDPERRPKSQGKPSKPNTPACVAHRSEADAALHEGDWVKLETLAKQPKCWPKRAQAKALLMRALFEQERFEECIELSKNDSSKEVAKWQKNCSRALQ
jgi:hypothetical protein